MTESRLQHLIIGWLKSEGCYVIKTTTHPGVPVGCPDVIAFKSGKAVFIEVKKSPTAKFQTGQELTHQHLRDLGFVVFVANPENWSEIKVVLSKYFTQ